MPDPTQVYSNILVWLERSGMYSCTRLLEWLKIQPEMLSVLSSCVLRLLVPPLIIYSHLVFFFFFPCLSCYWLSELTTIWIIHLGFIYLSQLSVTSLSPIHTDAHTPVLPCSLLLGWWIMEADLNAQKVDRQSSRSSHERPKTWYPTFSVSQLGHKYFNTCAEHVELTKVKTPI